MAVNAPADLVWDLVGRFNAFGQWHPMVKRSEINGRGRGALRKLHLVGGGTLLERLEYASDRDLFYLYSVIDGPLPLAHCVAEIQVTDHGDRSSLVEWSSRFVPTRGPERQVLDSVRRIYREGLENVKRIYQSSPAPAPWGQVHRCR